MQVNLSTDLLRNFVAIVDAGSMSRASREVHATQSALSLQMKRLADLVETPIFHRHHRGMMLTDAGKSLLTYSRAMLELNDRAVSFLRGTVSKVPVRIGMIQDFAESILSRVLVRISQVHPETEVQIRIASSNELLNQLSGGLHDIALCLGEVNDPGAITTAQMAWIGHPSLGGESRLPIALMEKPCAFRDAAIKSLEGADRQYEIVMETPSISVLRAAVNGGLALTLRTESFLNIGVAAVEGINLEPPKIAYCLHLAPIPTPMVLRIAQFIRNAVLGLPGVDRAGTAMQRSGSTEPSMSIEL